MSNRSRGRRRRITALIAAAATGMTLIAACGSGAAPAQPDTGASEVVTTAGSTSTEPAATSTVPGTAASSAPMASSEPVASTDSATGAGMATSGAASYPVTVTAANGDVTLASRPSAIVTLSPTSTEMLYAIDAGAQVVAADKNSNYPAGVPNATFDAYQLNIESVTTFHPDLVISSYLSDDEIAKFKALKIPVLVAPPAVTLDDTYAQIDQIGSLTGHVAEATALIERMKSDIAKIVKDATHFDPPATYYYELDQTYYSQTSDTYFGGLLASLGLHSIADKAEGAASSGGYPQLSAEFIVKSDPDYMFLADATCCSQTPVTVAARPGWAGLQAVTGGRVIALDDDLAARWGPRVVDLMREVADALAAHPAHR